MEHVIAPEDRYLVAISSHVKAGEPVEVDDETAASLRAQGWQSLRSASAQAAVDPAADEAEAVPDVGDGEDESVDEPSATDTNEE